MGLLEVRENEKHSEILLNVPGTVRDAYPATSSFLVELDKMKKSTKME
jgi:hypothetical protein